MGGNLQNGSMVATEHHSTVSLLSSLTYHISYASYHIIYHIIVVYHTSKMSHGPGIDRAMPLVIIAIHWIRSNNLWDDANKCAMIMTITMHHDT